MATVRRRGSWNPRCWSFRAWLVFASIFLVLSPFASRWFFLRSVPEVTLPFEVEDIISTEITKDENAFEQYAIAAQMFAPFLSGPFPETLNAALDTPDHSWDANVENVLTEFKPVLTRYRRGCEMERAAGISLKDADDVNIFPLELHQALRTLSSFAAVEAIRCERMGDLKDAWDWLRANLRCATHAQMPGLSYCQQIACGIRSKAFRGIVLWSQNSDLTVQQLRVAQAGITEEYAKRTTLIDVAKADYLLLRNTLRRADAPNILYPAMDSGTAFEPHFLFMKRQAFWVVGQPELMLRLARQMLVNLSDQIDRPIERQSKRVHSNGEIVFEFAPDSRRLPGQLAPIWLAALLNHRLPNLPSDEIPFFVPNEEWPLFNWIPRIERQFRYQETRFAMTKVVLSCQQFQRLHGEFPRDLRQLVPEFLDELPHDPMSLNQAPLQYRREPNGDGIVWHAASDDMDQSDDLEMLMQQDRCDIIRVRTYQADQKTKGN